MVDSFSIFIDYIGTANLLAIILFLLSLFFAGYFYFRTFYRLVYSTGKICTNCRELGDLGKENNQYKTRFLFYNNGRKTLTKEENKELTIFSKNGEITNAKVLVGTNINLSQFENSVDIDFDYLDAKNLFIIQIEHNGHLKINGRISETGKILNTEPKNWIIINLIFFALSIGLIFFTIYEFYNVEGIQDMLPIGINLAIIFLVILVIRFIHSLFFIPDNISSKYLNPKSKIQNEFITDI